MLFAHTIRYNHVYYTCIILYIQVTTGASGDLQQIFRIARAMVTQLGMYTCVIPM